MSLIHYVWASDPFWIRSSRQQIEDEHGVPGAGRYRHDPLDEGWHVYPFYRIGPWFEQVGLVEHITNLPRSNPAVNPLNPSA